MNYEHHYNLLIERAKTRSISGYTEKHHIIPKCMGGTDDVENLVNLYADEHYIAHLLLAKMYPENHKLLFAANMMCVTNSGQRRTNKRHKWLREKLANAISISNSGRVPANKGVAMSEEQKLKLSDTWEFTHPCGKSEIVYGLNEFCRKYSLNGSAMSAVSKGARRHHKGFTCKKLTNTDSRHSVTWKPKKRVIDKVHNQIAVKINGIEYKSIGYAMSMLNLKRHEVIKLNEYTKQ